MPERAAVITELERHGIKLQELNQGERGRQTLARGQGLDRGFCTGFCFDWMRKVILGGNHTYLPKAEKTPDQKTQTVRNQTLRAADVHLNKTNFRQTDVANYGTASASADELRELISFMVNTVYNPHKDEKQVKLGPNTMSDLRNHFVLASDTLTLSTILDLINRLTAKYAAQASDLDRRRLELDRLADFPVSGRAFTTAMDNLVAERRADADKEGQATRTFSAIEVTTASAPQNYASPGALLDALVADPGLIVSRGSVFGMDINTPTGASGHAVATYRTGETQYLFMDPNYGVFNCAQAGLRASVQYLFGTAYQDNGWTVPGTGNYAIFQRAEAG